MSRLDLPKPLSWYHVLPLDSTLSIGIMAIVTVLIVGDIHVSASKARMTEVFYQLSTSRAAAMERIAVEGMLTAPSNHLSPVQTGASSKFSYQMDGTSLFAEGRLRANEQPFRLALHPAVEEAGVGWAVLWLCGNRKPPPGWSTSAAQMTANLTPEQLPSICKETQAP